MFQYSRCQKKSRFSIDIIATKALLIFNCRDNEIYFQLVNNIYDIFFHCSSSYEAWKDLFVSAMTPIILWMNLRRFPWEDSIDLLTAWLNLIPRLHNQRWKKTSKKFYVTFIQWLSGLLFWKQDRMWEMNGTRWR